MKKIPFAAASLLSLGTCAAAFADPTGGTVVAGQGTISSTPGTTTIDQASNLLHLNWRSFDVAANESVQFNQPSSSAVAFNRILDQNPSQIFGRIGANGQVVLVNPNGLLIGRTAQLNVGSLVVSSLDITGFDAATGRYRFGTSLANPGAVLNEGFISAAPGGSVTLLGGRVANSGTILADFGTVNLAAGRAATIDLAGDGLLRLEVGAALTAADAAGSSAVENAGTISANGGQVQLTAQALEGVFANLVNNSGVVRANRIDNAGGTIRLLGPGGAVRSSGILDASAGDAVSTGGRVEMLGDRVGLFGNARVDVSGATGGGVALIGGDFQGKNPDVLNASRTYVGAGAVLDANAGLTGDGGRVIVWADEVTRFDGSVNARGGSLWGNGGFAEVSGKQSLWFHGNANLSAAAGATGTLLLDPDDIVIIDDADDTAPPGADDPGVNVYAFADDPGGGTISNSAIETLLAQNDVVLQGTDTITQDADADIDVSGVGAADGNSLSMETTNGDIVLNANISLNDGAFTLDSGNDITLAGVIDTDGGAISLTAANDISMATGAELQAGAGTVELTAAQSVTVIEIATTGTVDITATAGSILDDGANGTRINAGGLVTLAAGGAIGAAGANGQIDLAADSLEATAAGDIFIGELNALELQTITSAAGDVTIVAGTSLTDDDNDGTLITADALTLTAGVAIGTTAGNGEIDTDVNSITATATTGSVAITEANSVDILSITSGNDVNVDAAGNMVVSTVTAADDVTLTAVGALLDDGAGTRISGDALTLTAGAGIGVGGGGPIDTSVTSLSAGTTTGNIAIDELNGVTLTSLTANSAGSDINVTAGGTLAVVAIDADDDVTLVTTGAITDDGNIGTQIEGDALTLTATSIGTAGAPVDTNVALITATASVGEIQIRDAGSVTLGAISAPGTVAISAVGSLDDDANDGTRIAANALTLTAGTSIGAVGNNIDTTATLLNATANGGGVTISEQDDLQIGSVSASGGNNVSLTAAGVLTDDLNQSTVIAGNVLTLDAVAIGSSVANGALDTDVGSLLATTSNGGVYINEATAIALTSVNAMGAGSDVIVTNTTGNLTASAVFSSSDVTLTAANGDVIAGNINIVDAVTLNATTGSVLDDGNNGTLILANSVTMNAGTAIGSAAGNGQIDTLVNSISATAGNGSIVIAETDGVTLTNVSASGAGSDVTISAGGALVANVVDAVDDVSLTASSVLDDGNDSTRISGDALTLTATNAIGSAAASGEIDTDAASLTATAGNGGVYIGELNALTLTNVAANGAGNDVVVTNTTGNLTATLVTAPDAVTLSAVNGDVVAGAVTAGGLATLTASAGAITDDNNDATVINGTTGVALSASTAVGTVTDFTAATDAAVGSSVDIQTNGTLGVTVASNTGQINLNVAGAPTLGAGAITLGSGAGRAGSVVLQSAANLDAAGLAAGAINIGAGNTTNVGLRSGGVLTLPAGGGFTDQPAGQLLVRGATDVVDNDGTPRNLTFAANSLDFRSGAAGGATTLTTAVGQLAATIGNGQNLTVSEADDVALASVSTTGDISITAVGAITDDGNAATRVSGNGVSLSGTAVGAPGFALGTQATALDATASVGDIDIAEADSLTLTASAAESVVVRTTNGSLAVNGVSAADGIELSAGGAGSVLSVNGPVTGEDLVALSATGTNGSIELNAGVTSTTNNVILDADGAIVANTGHLVTGGALFLDGSSIGTSSARLNTAVTALNATADNGIFITDVDSLLNIDANAGTGAVDIATTNGVLGVSSASGSDITFTAGGAGSSITLNGQLNAGAGDVFLTADGAIVAGIGNLVVADTLTATGSTIGLNGANLNTTIASLDAVSTGGVFVTETNDLQIVNAQGGTGTVAVETNDGEITVDTIQANNVILTARGAANDIIVNGPVTSNAGVNINAAGAGADVFLNSVIDGGNSGVFVTAGALGNHGAIVGGTGHQVTGISFVGLASTIGSSGARIETDVNTVGATSTNGGTFITEANDLFGLNGTATGGVLDVRTTDGSLEAGVVSGSSVTLIAGGDGNNLSMTSVTGTNGVTLAAAGAGGNVEVSEVDAGTGDVTISAGTAGNRGAVIAVGSAEISGNNLTVTGSTIGTSAARLNTAVASLDATSTGGVFVTEADALTVNNVVAGTGAIDVQTTNGALTVGAVAGNSVTLAAGGAGSALTLNGAVDAGAGDVTLTAGTAGNRGAINAGANTISGNALTVSGASVGTSGSRLNTNVASLNATGTNGVFVTEANALTVTSAQGGAGAVDVQTTNGALTVTAAAGAGVALTAGGAGNGIALNGAVNAGSGDVSLTAGTAGNRGAITAGAGNLVTGNVLTAQASAVGANAAHLNTNVSSLTADASNGGVFVAEQNGLTLASVTAAGAGGNVNVTSTSGDILVDTVTASGTVGLAASAGAITDDGDDTTRISGTAMTFTARSIGAPSTLAGTVLDSEMRLDLDATSLDATSTSGGIFIDELNGLQNVRLSATGAAGGDIELLTATGDLNLDSVLASDALLLAAGHNIFANPGASGIVARVAELRAGAADSTQGRIGTLVDPITLTLAAGDSLRLFVPQSVDPNDANRAPSTLPSAGVSSSLTRFNTPSTLAVQAGFGQFLGVDTTPFSSPLESLVRTLQNQTQTVRTVLEIDWASFDSSVSLFGTLDPALCLPGDQRDEEAPQATCQ